MNSRVGRKVWGKYVRVTSEYLNRRRLSLSAALPVATFTFDDFPRSALQIGGDILEAHAARATYFASLGLMGGAAPTGTMFEEEDLGAAIDRGHEIGCHTYDHCDAGNVLPAVFEESVARNAKEFGIRYPTHKLQTLSYPLSEPRPGIKRKMGSRFACCRGGGQSYNRDSADLNRLQSFFIERSRDNPDTIYRLIDRARLDSAWLIFSTHDVSPTPTPWGCTPLLFEDVVRRVVQSGFRILPLFEALRTLKSGVARSRHDASLPFRN